MSVQDGTLTRQPSPRPEFIGKDKGVGGGLSPEHQELALDVAQVTLDIVGIFEPTPFADGTNAAISIGRGDWLGAGLSAMGMIPYVGDLAKAGKLPRYADSIRKAAHAAKTNVRFASHLEPVFIRMQRGIDALPWEMLAKETAEQIYRLRRQINAFLYRDLVDKVLKVRLGSLSNVGSVVRENVETVVDFVITHERRYKHWGGKGADIEKAIHETLSGVDIHNPVSIVRMEPGTKIAQYVDEWFSLDPAIAIRRQKSELKGGNWLVKKQGAVGPDHLGIADAGRSRITGEIVRPVELLESKAAAVNDKWTTQVKQNLTDGVSRSKGEHGMPTRGGGMQYYLPKASDFIRYDQ